MGGVGGRGRGGKGGAAWLSTYKDRTEGGRNTKRIFRQSNPDRDFVFPDHPPAADYTSKLHAYACRRGHRICCSRDFALTPADPCVTQIMGVTNPAGKEWFIAAAFPSACGKTNLAMLKPSLPGWKVRVVGETSLPPLSPSPSPAPLSHSPLSSNRLGQRRVIFAVISSVVFFVRRLFFRIPRSLMWREKICCRFRK